MNSTNKVPSLQQLLELDLNYINAKAATEFDSLAGKTVWFTGSAGFIGYYFCLAIAHFNKTNSQERQIRLLAIDNYVRGVPAWLSDLEQNGTQIVEHDVLNDIPESWPAADYIVHAASIASPPFYRKYPLETIDANVTGLRKMLDYAAERATPLSGLLFFSTSEIYGDPPADEIPTKETFRGLVSSTGPRACYDESKRLGETLCVTFAQTRGVPVTMARPFNNYGPGLKLQDGRVVPDFAGNALTGEDIVLLSDGTPTRTFCYIADAVVGYLKVLVNGTPGEPYNIGIETPEISMRQIADLIAHKAQELWQYKGKVTTQESSETAYLTDNPERRCPDISKAREQIGFDPAITIDEGIERTLAWYYHMQKDL